ncbi:unnamed protein product [Candida verbasci]|uniref:Uncharacterized protein n=1 Tax=Candida verbasci TaxID=1227364 RepID=A0A9W4TT00_9ASCO|nr:unnamed protein product [Candida verbasci]
MNRGKKRGNSNNNNDTDNNNIDKLKQSRKDNQQNINGIGSGLDIELHPLLRNITTTQAKIVPKYHNPVTNQSGKKWFDPTLFNPYIDQSTINKPPRASHKSRALKFNKQGKYIAKGDKLREQLKIEQEEQQEFQKLQAQGLIPNKNIGEDLYKIQYPPLIEWWDRPYLRDNNYSNIQDESRLVLDNDDQPITSYIQHPILLPPIWDHFNQIDTKIYLTKKERKRIRRNDRQIRHKEKQDRIKLGFEPPPPPKVKLSNLMNVLTNEAIKDPTAVENRVKKEVQRRLDKHLAENEARKLTKEQKHEKIISKQEKDLSKGLHSVAYKVNDVSNPQHLFKINMNAKQLGLYGILLKNPKFNIIIVEGGEKSINQYKKLLLNRIKWTDSIQSDINLSNNKCQIIWEGQLNETNFQKWSIMYSRNDEEALKVLKRFKLENYWSLCNSIE